MGIELLVGGQNYGGWKTMTVVQSIKAFSGAFNLTVTDNWTGSGPVVIKAGDECRLKIGGTPVVTGYVDGFENTLDGSNHTIAVSGRDKTADLVDCSAIVGQGEILNQDLVGLARALVGPFGIQFRAEVSGGAQFKNFSIQPGESVFTALDRAGKLRGRVFLTDGTGALVLTEIGKKKARGALVEGQNIKIIAYSADTKDRFSQYIIKAQKTGTDDAYGATVAHVKAEASDATVNRYRPLVVIAEDQADAADALKRAEWEAKTRAANSTKVVVTVQGFEQAEGGPLWTINELVGVESKTMGIKQELLVSEVEMRMDEGGRRTQLTLVRPDAFLPEPVVAKKTGGSSPEEVEL